jgi:cholesterol oxidase
MLYRNTVSDGVVNHAGEVFGYRNLYVADAAIIPEALGVNPSRTIGALAECVVKIIKEEGR